MDGMTLYTSKVVAQWLCLTERRVRQLRDEGVIVEARPGLYELQPDGGAVHHLHRRRGKGDADQRAHDADAGKA